MRPGYEISHRPLEVIASSSSPTLGQVVEDLLLPSVSMLQRGLPGGGNGDLSPPPIGRTLRHRQVARVSSALDQP
jgi:hypothetical protein